MPPRIRTRASKAMKENVNTNNKLNNVTNGTKTTRRALADKTNSASDENSDELPTKVSSKRLTTRGLPSNMKSNAHKENEIKITPVKTPSGVETSLVINRPRRICRLPSRFDDHLISPSKVIGVQPGNASTPIQQSKTRTVDKVTRNSGNADIKIQTPPEAPKHIKNKAKAPLDANFNSDTNNNAKGRSTRARKPVTMPSALKKSDDKDSSPKKLDPKPLTPKKVNSKVITPNKFFNRTASPDLSVTKTKTSNIQRVIDKSLSFQVLGGKKKSQKSVARSADVYEFTFDPTEEPKPIKKKRKKPTKLKQKQKASEPKATYKRVYDQNISKALSALKNAIKPSQNLKTVKIPEILETCDEVEKSHNEKANTACKDNFVTPMNTSSKTPGYSGNYPSIRIEDIAADIEPSVNNHNNFDYSPVNSPRPPTPASNRVNPQQNSVRINTDPLNLQEDLSFFDDIPVASSSMNVSVRHPLASPWRVEFGSLPIKWHSNTYVKPNMTPAVESSFICAEDSTKKKHVYTNLLADTNEPLPQNMSESPAFKQTSILSFIKEVAEKKAKKKRGRSVSPSKAMGVQSTNKDVELNMPTENESNEESNNQVSNDEVSEPMDTSNNTEKSMETRKTRKRKNDENVCDKPAKSPRNEKDKDCTYFGFDESEDQENVSPVKPKVNPKGRSLRPKARAVLQEINGPTRAALPLAAKSKVVTSSEAVNKVYEGLKSGADAPVFPEENIEVNLTNVDDIAADDSQSVHLFEDIEVVHHLKPSRKSYGKAKKVTFRQQADDDATGGQTCVDDNSSFEDDLADLTFEVNVQEKKKSKKKRPKKLMSKKEEKEAEEWAAGFNSMCEEIEEFPLMVE